MMAIPGNAPFTGQTQGRITGVIAEATLDALRGMGCKANGRRLPFPRMYRWVHSGRIDVAPSVLKTRDRASQAHYSDPIITEFTVVMVPKGQGFPLNQVRDLRGRRIGAQLGFAYPPIDGIGLKLIRERSYEVNVRKVAEGRLDGTLIGSITGPVIAERMGLSDRVEFLPNALGKVELGTALSRRAFTVEQSRAFDRQIARLQGSPRWREILAANGVNALIRPWPIVR